MRTLEGSCHCGAVRFSVKSHTPQPYMHCYCSICRKTAGGGGYAIYEVVPRAWTLFFAEMVEHPELAAELNDSADAVPQQEAQDRVWGSLRKEMQKLGELHDVMW